MAQTAAQRKASERKRKKEAGLVEVRGIWIKPEHQAAVKQYARQLESA